MKETQELPVGRQQRGTHAWLWRGLGRRDKYGRSDGWPLAKVWRVLMCRSWAERRTLLRGAGSPGGRNVVSIVRPSRPCR